MNRINTFTWALRVTAVLHLLAVLAQAALAGQFVTGDVDMLAMHRMNGDMTMVLAFVQLIAAVLIWRPGRGPAAPARMAAGLFVAVSAQWSLGAARVIALHFPLGVLIFGGAVMITVWAWRFQPSAAERAVTA